MRADPSTNRTLAASIDRLRDDFESFRDEVVGLGGASDQSDPLVDAIGEQNAILREIADTLDLLYTYSVKPDVHRPDGPFKTT